MTVMQHISNNYFEDLIRAPIGGRGRIPVDIGLDEGALTFENPDLSSFTFGDEEYAGAVAPEAPVEPVGKECTGRFTQ